MVVLEEEVLRGKCNLAMLGAGALDAFYPAQDLRSQICMSSAMRRRAGGSH